MPIQSVQLYSVSADGAETVVESGMVTLSGGDEGRARSVGGVRGVACVAAVNGSLSRPDMRVMMDTDDVTRMFDDVTTSRILDDPETDGSQNGLGIFYVERRMSYVPSSLDTSWNNKMLTCIADYDGLPDNSVSAIVTARCMSKPLVNSKITEHWGFKGIVIIYVKIMLSATNKTLKTRNAWQSLAYSPLGAVVSPPSKYL